MRRILLQATALSTALAGGTAFAQQPQTTDNDYGDIVVTAQKRTENVQDVPKSVDVVSVERLAESGVTRITDLSAVAPSVSGSNTPFTGTPAIRGISSFSFSVGLQGQTGVVIDDVPQSPFSNLANELADLQRVEVFPGPQSTLSGRNAAGGLINIVTRRPEKQFSADFMAEQTSDHQTRFQGFLTGPIAPSLAFSLSGFFNDWDGPLRNQAQGGKRLGGWRTWGTRAKLLWELSDKVEATLTGFYVENKSINVPTLSGNPYISVDPRVTHRFAPATASFASLFPGITPGPFNRDTSAAIDSVSRSKDRGGSLNVSVDVGALGTVSSISAFTKTSLPRVDNFIAPSVGVNGRVDVTYESEQISQELRLASPSGQPFTYLIGAIYSDNDIFFPYSRLNIFSVNWVRNSSFASLAFYGRGTLQATDKLSITGGLRYQRDKQGWDWDFLTTSAPYTSTAYRSGGSKYDFVSGEVSLKYDFTPDINAYVTASTSQTGEAYDLENQVGALAGTLQPITSEKVKNIEFGFKAQSPDRKWTANLNFFHARYSNYQIQTIEPLATADPNRAPVIRIFPIGKVETTGAEFVGAFRPSHELSFNVNAAYLDAKIKDYPNAACYNRQTVAQGCVGGFQANLAGKSMPNTPKFKINGSARYELEMPSAPFDASFTVFARYQSRSNGDLFGNPVADLPAYTIVNASVGLSDHDDRFELTLFVNNLFNKKYYASHGDDTQLNVPGLATIPAITATYARDSFRYGGIRLSTRF